MNNSKKFGYIRVSSREQNLDRQEKAMLAYGISERDIFADKKSGKDTNRPQYQALKQILRASDTVVIKSIDRLGRNYDDIRNEWNDIVNNLHCNIEVIDMPVLNTTNENSALMGKVVTDILLTLLGYVAEQERTFNKSRQSEGIATAHEKGVKFGRPKTEKPNNFDEILKKVKNKEITAVQAMHVLNMKKTTFYKLAKN